MSETEQVLVNIVREGFMLLLTASGGEAGFAWIATTSDEDVLAYIQKQRDTDQPCFPEKIWSEDAEMLRFAEPFIRDQFYKAAQELKRT